MIYSVNTKDIVGILDGKTSSLVEPNTISILIAMENFFLENPDISLNIKDFFPLYRVLLRRAKELPGMTTDDIAHVIAYHVQSNDQSSAPKDQYSEFFFSKLHSRDDEKTAIFQKKNTSQEG